MNPNKNIQMQEESSGGIVVDVFPRTKSTIVETDYGTLDKVLHNLYFNGSSSGGIAPGEDAHVRNIYVDGNILPNGADKVIGAKTNRFKAIYVDEVYMSTNTLYIGDTPILGTNKDTIQIKADPNQSINMMTSGAGVTKVLSESGVEFSTSGMNANVVIQAKGINSQTNIAATSEVNFNAPTLNFNGESRVDNLTIRGNLTVLGSNVSVEAESVKVKDNILELNKGEPGSGVTAGTAGLRIDRGDAPSYNILFDEADDLFKVGMDNQLETIASREWVKANSTNYVHPATHPASMITGLATVATSGSYNDLSNKPTSFPPASHNHDSVYLKLTGGNISGNLNFDNNEIRAGGAEKDVLVMSAMGGGIILRPIKGDTTKQLSINKEDIVFNNNYKLYHQGFKPTPTDIGAALASHDHNSLYYTRTESNNSFFKRRGAIAGDTNWNTVREPGVYKVQMSAWTTGKGAPEMGLYSYGLLEVLISDVESEGRVLQVYHPHRTDHPRVFRMCNNDVWQDWQKWHVEASADTRYYHAGNKPSPSDIGALGKTETANNSYLVSGKNFVWEWGTGNPTHIWGSQGNETKMQVWSPTNITVGNATKLNNMTSDSFQPKESTKFTKQSEYVAVRTEGRTPSQYYEFWDSNVGWASIKSGELYVNGSSRVYHEGNKPTPNDLGLGNITTLRKNTYSRFTVGGDANIYYPVVISVGREGFGQCRIDISRGYSWTAPDTWNTATHKGGLTLSFETNGDNYWGGNGNGYTVYDFHETYTTMVAGINKATNGIVVWLRGGGALYQLDSDYGTASTASVQLSGFTDAANREFAPRADLTRVQSEIHYYYGNRNGTLYDNGNRVWSAGNKPTPSDIGALPITGGVISGETTFNNYMSLNAWPGYGTGKASLWYNETAKELVIQPGPANLRLNGNLMYHPGNRPTPADIGALGKTEIAVDSTRLANRTLNEVVPLKSLRDFTNGTLIKTSLDATDGTPFLLEITGNSYTGSMPFDLKVQGYLYNGDTINYSALSTGNTNFTSIDSFRYEGKLCFWLPRGGYWQGFTAKCDEVSSSGASINRVIAIENVVRPTAIDKLKSIPITTAYRPGNEPNRVGDDTVTILPHRSNEINFGGSYKSNQYMFFGYRDIDGRPAPTKYVFGNNTIGSAEVYAKDLYASGNKVYHAGNRPTASEVGALPISGGTLTGRLTLKAGSDSGVLVGGIKVDSVDSGSLAIRNLRELRFGDNDSWSWNEWGGAKYSSSAKTLYLGGPAGNVFSANSAPSMITVDLTQGVSSVTAPIINTTEVNSSGILKTKKDLVYDNNKSPGNTSQIGVQSGNNSMGIGLDSTFNSRSGWLQVGHSDNSFASHYGTLRLNPKGGEVRCGSGGFISEGNIAAQSGGEALRLVASSGDHVYMGFYPRSADLGNRGCWMGYGSAGTTRFTISASELINIDPGIHAQNESKFSNTLGYFTDPWVGQGCAIKAHGSIACNDRIKAWNGTVTYAAPTSFMALAVSPPEEVNNTYMVDPDDIVEDIKDIRIYQHTQTAPDGDAVTPVATAYSIDADTLPLQVVDYTGDGDDNKINQASLNAMLAEGIKYNINKTEELIAGFGVLISRLTEAEEKIQKLEGIINGNTGK